MLLNWGPVIPCSILGIAVLTLFTDPITSSHEEALFKDLGVPLIGATLGAMIGIIIDWNLTHPQRTELTSGEFADGESNEIAT